MKNPIVLGIDIGNQGARVVAVDTMGRVFADVFQKFAKTSIPGLPSGYLEQNPEDWWIAVRLCLRLAISELSRQGYAPNEIIAGSVDSISGIILLLDKENRPLRPALMHDDRRAEAEAEELNIEYAALRKKLGYRFDPSFGLPKILWLIRHEPETWKRTNLVAYAADYIVGKITGVFGITDQNNALKSGFDLLDFSWPPYFESSFGIDEQQLPKVIRSGETIGNISKQCAEEIGLVETTLIVAGMTSASANQIASGTRRIGDWNTLLGTSIVFKGLTKDLLVDPQERVYSHLHPLGYWMPSSMSNINIRVLEESFPDVTQRKYRHKALSLAPTSLWAYPFETEGENFEIDHSNTERLIEGHAGSEEELYVAHLEATAYYERLIYGVLSSLGADIRERIYNTGDGAENREWMQIRADVLGMECAHATNANAAMGSAIVAASRTFFESIEEASAQMIRLDFVISPRPEMVLRYADIYPIFLDACRRHGLLSDIRQSPDWDFY